MSDGSPLVLGALTNSLDAVRLSLHVLGATVWVGGQLTVAGLLSTVRGLGEEAPRRVARAFARLGWPAYVLLLGTGIWNVSAVHLEHQNATYKAVLGAKIAVVVLAGLATYLHQKVKSRALLGAFGGLSGIFSLAALVLGVFLGG